MHQESTCRNKRNCFCCSGRDGSGGLYFVLHYEPLCELCKGHHQLRDPESGFSGQVSRYYRNRAIGKGWGRGLLYGKLLPLRLSMDKSRKHIPCPYSESCFTCPLPDCRISEKKICQYNALPDEYQMRSERKDKKDNGSKRSSRNG